MASPLLPVPPLEVDVAPADADADVDACAGAGAPAGGGAGGVAVDFLAAAAGIAGFSPFAAAASVPGCESYPVGGSGAEAAAGFAARNSTGRGGRTLLKGFGIFGSVEDNAAAASPTLPNLPPEKVKAGVYALVTRALSQPSSKTSTTVILSQPAYRVPFGSGDRQASRRLSQTSRGADPARRPERTKATTVGGKYEV